MATYLFSQLPKQATLNFDPALDTLNFDNTGISAASGVIVQDGADLLLTYQHKTIRLAGFSLAQLSGSHFTFSNGGKLLVGDDSPATLEDDLANTLNGTSRDDYLNGLGGADRLYGREGNDLLFGGTGNDKLNGGAGSDRLFGGEGNDLYVVNSLGDRVVELGADPAQIDTVYSRSHAYTLPANVENLRLLGTLDFNGVGNELDNRLIGNDGDNLLDGGEGADLLVGGKGNDTYVVDNAGDRVVEREGIIEQIDTVQSSLAMYVLPDHVENLQLLGEGNLNGTGNGLANVLTGNAGDNMLDGQGRADVLRGGGGDDMLRVADLDFAEVDGGEGSDTLVLTGSGLTLDLDVLESKLHDLEAIDLGNNRLVLTAAAVESVSSGGLLVVNGMAGATINLGAGWIQGEDTTVQGKSYHTYTQGTATLWVSVALHVNDVMSLASLDGGNGFRLDGVADYDESGSSVSAAGDVNGDGFGDLLVGAHGVAPNGNWRAGSSYVVFGQASGFAATLELSSLDGNDGFRLDSVAEYGLSVVSVSAAGDVNGDGFGDLIIGAGGADPNGNWDAGSSYVVFGQASGFAATLELSSLDGGNGFRLDGVAEYDYSGLSVSAAGDVNGDGFGDLLVGAFRAAPNGNDKAGSSYVVFGQASDFAPVLSLSILDGGNGFRLDGEANGDYSGFSVSAAGDVNGDGFGDLLVGAHWADPNGNWDAGSSYVVFGQASGFVATLALSSLDGNNGFRLDGVSEYDFSGVSVCAAGDVNGDGFGDLIIGASGADPNGNWDAGSSYVVFGQASGFAATLELSSLDGGNGFRLDGVAEYDYSGWSVSAAGDVNGDGFGDLLVGAIYADPNGNDKAGSSYVVFGQASGFASVLSLSTLDGGNGFRLDGEANGDFSGSSVSAAGDVNGDGFGDLLVGASRAEPDGNRINRGFSYVVFGSDFTHAVTHLGSEAGDTFTGTAEAERFVSAQGNDMLTGGGGADVFAGGEGDDRMQIPDLAFQRLDGGSGIDTLALTGAGLHLNLADFRNQIFGIEQIDLTGSGDNTLGFLTRDLLNLSDTSNTLQVDGDAGDRYDLQDGDWVQGADVILLGVAYHSYDSGAAHLLLNAALTAA